MKLALIVLANVPWLLGLYFSATNGGWGWAIAWLLGGHMVIIGISTAFFHAIRYVLRTVSTENARERHKRVAVIAIANTALLLAVSYWAGRF